MNFRPPIDPYLQQQWIEEVRFLHSLWHRGLPQHHINVPYPNLHPVNDSNFKRKGKRKKKNLDGKQIVEKEWPCLPPQNEKKTDWKEWKSSVIEPIKNKPVSEQERAKLFALQIQRKVVHACHEFFRGGNVSGQEEEQEGYDDDDDDDEEEEEDALDDNDGESKNFRFFSEIFKQGSDLRAYYEKNYEKGEFMCLVCGGIGKKISKRFISCSALVQHSWTVTNTKKQKAHRDFVRVVCKVLGWDVNRLPTIVTISEENAGGGTISTSDRELITTENNGSDQKEDSTKQTNDILGAPSQENGTQT